jgi:hypothetical protein
MPQRNTSRRLVLRLVLFTLAGWLVWALGKGAKASAGAPETVSTAVPDGSEPTRGRGKQGAFSKRRFATTLAFTTLFFAGAAFSAGAGDVLVGALEGSSTCATEATEEAAPEESCDPALAEDQSAEEAAPAEETPSDEATETTSDATPADDESGNDQSADDESGEAAGDDAGASGDGDSAGDQPAGDDQSGEPADDGSSADGSSDSGEPGSDSAPGGNDASGSDDEWADEPLDDEPQAGPGSAAHAGDESDDDSGHDVGLTSADDAGESLDFDEAAYGVVWLNRTLPDPTPPAMRLDADFARALLRASRTNHVDWALVLGVLRASGHRDSWPASVRSLRQLAHSLSALKANADAWRAALALGGRTAFADRVIAMTRYNRAVGLRSLVRGLEAEKASLEQKVLSDSRLDIYAGGRDDVSAHRINVRVLVLMLYMAECYGQVTVSSLDTGHGLFARPGVISAHKYGLAVDIAALGGTSILNHQDPGGLTEHAVRDILLLPVEVRPKQVISLLGLGGPSFPLADHYDHIHVGY